MFRQSQKIKGYKKSAATLAALILLVGGVAFALLQSQTKLTGNSISTVSTGLLISQNDSNYGPTTAGYNFSGVIPGAQPSQTEHFVLKNTGSTALALKLGVTSMPANPSNIDLNKVHVILTPYSTTTFMPGTPQSFSLQSLMDSADSGVAIDYPDPLAASTKEEFNIQMSMDADAVSGSSASLSNIDLGLIGVATSTTP
ncbi:MAG TPA: hypothetical protein VFH99_00565 [Candidatus Saccharimonadales bacterium]|nr:hypothetical protein [Candidatus Saccharimonadales bacterium]